MDATSRDRARAVFLIFTLWLVAVGARAEPLSPRIANYEIDARLDAGQHRVSAREVLTWRNTADEPVGDLYFHLYLNAFANTRSSFMREMGERVRDWMRDKPDGWGYLGIAALHVDGDDRTEAIEYVHPDDDNADDRTVARVPLPAPIAPGASVRVEIDFTAQLPKVLARSGYAGPFVFVAQWFPKIGVFEHGAWNCHQYHFTSEFYADFGVYDVRLTVPREVVVGATGTVVEERDNRDGSQTLRYHAEDVHDFAWTVDPRFVEVRDRFDSVAIRVLMQPLHRLQALRYLDAAKAALRRYRDWIGPYPYPQLTIVDPGPGGYGAGGMEYPTLITVGTAWWMPEKARLPEEVTVHEFGHQYWYGMVANNEFESAWLDEGLNSYVEWLIMDEAYPLPGSYADLFGLKFDGLARNRLSYLLATQHDPLVRPAWEFLDRRSYASISYAKTALMLATLERSVGRERLLAALRAYFARWRFGHPTGRDFLAAVSESIGEDLSWYFDQTVAGTGVLDYAVTRVSVDDAIGFAGVPIPTSAVAEATPVSKERLHRNEVIVERLGAVRMPVDVAVVFEDGTETFEWWDGQDRWRRFEYTGPQRVDHAVVDPHNKLPLDVDILNNSRMRDEASRGIVRLAGRWGFWFQNLLHLLAGL